MSLTMNQRERLDKAFRKISEKRIKELPVVNKGAESFLSKIKNLLKSNVVSGSNINKSVLKAEREENNFYND